MSTPVRADCLGKSQADNQRFNWIAQLRDIRLVTHHFRQMLDTAVADTGGGVGWGGVELLRFCVKQWGRFGTHVWSSAPHVVDQPRAFSFFPHSLPEN